MAKCVCVCVCVREISEYIHYHTFVCVLCVLGFIDPVMCTLDP